MAYTFRRVTALTALALLTTTVPAIGFAAPEKATVIVVLDRGTDPEASALEAADRFGGEVGYVYRHALRGFTITLPMAAVEGLSRAQGVVSVEPDFEVTVAQVGTQPVPTGVDRVEADRNPPVSPVPIDIAILDTGIWYGTNPDGSLRSHQDLNLRYLSDCTGAILYPIVGGCTAGGQDGHGHGTHVAGIAAAYDNAIGSIGTAPGATLWSFKVLNDDGTGTGGSLVAGIDLVAANADQIEVANMSLGFEGTSSAIDTAITGAVDAGVVFVVAAGNAGKDASTTSPANHPDVVTVSALADFDGKPGGLGSPTCRTDQDDTLADFSNYGPLVEIAAPGVCIYSTYLDDGYTTFSGTSMASPAVAGAVARYLAHIGLDPKGRSDVINVRTAIVDAGMPASDACGWGGDFDAYPEPLLFVNSAAFGGDGTCDGGGGSTNQTPNAGFTFSCADLTCDFTDTSTDPDGTVTTWSWSFGDGSGSTLQSPSHTFGAPGSYPVSLTVTDDGGLVSTTSQTVTVTEPAPASKVGATVGPIQINGRTATVEVRVTDDRGNPVGGATVDGTWTYLDRRGRTRTSAVSQTGDPSGTLVFSHSFPPGSTVKSFCVNNVTATGLTYDGGNSCGYPPLP